MKTYKVGIIGAGLQAKRRIPALLEFTNTEIAGITSKTLKKAQVLGNSYKIPVVGTLKELVTDKSIDIILVTTYPDSHKEISLEAFKHGKHVLCEKPLAINSKQAQEMIDVAKRYKKILKCGFNHRFHPAILEAKRLIENGTLGKLLFGRGVYGHLGRPGFEKEWRANKKYSTGGILMDQGIHLVDLFRWFFLDFQKVICFSDALYFPIKPFEDSAFLILKTKHNQSVSIHSTNLQWKNTFLMEIFGTEGYIKVEGLGASYGIEKLIVGMKDYHGPFKETITEYRGTDVSWKAEWGEFLNAIEQKREPVGNGIDGMEAIHIIEAAYSSSKKGKAITL